MELSEAVVEGLKVAGSSSLSDQLFRSLLSRAVQVSPTSSDEGNPSQHTNTRGIIYAASQCTFLNVDVDYLTAPVILSLCPSEIEAQGEIRVKKYFPKFMIYVCVLW